MVESPLRQRRAHSLTRVCNAGRGGIFKRGWPLRMTGIRWPSTQRTKFVGVPSYPRSSISYLKREVFTRRVCYRRLPTSASACLPTSSIFLSKPSLWNKTNSRDPFSELTRCVLQLERREALYHPCLQCKPSLQFPNPKTNQTHGIPIRRDKITIHSKAVVCQDVELKGDITIGAGMYFFSTSRWFYGFILCSKELLYIQKPLYLPCMVQSSLVQDVSLKKVQSLSIGKYFPSIST